ncbi:T9SS type A sorting domain-containing protein [Psychroserpens ponticola]|uniref:T9SS type A sorting domain-containing protein n=1 Tax=Psychroserpens ponticola TaxID=2932268 RepID=A0ABY7RXD3_9FLAO|nr:T9SS type A sorting domain-containing protein [Psychroserpens ponticola]WCO01513.1 T9SS type A sorting domain-containing protein [Psychroserpens ponticola]
MKKLILFLTLFYYNINYAQTLYAIDQDFKISTYDQNGQLLLIKQFEDYFSDIAVSSLGEIYLTSSTRLYHYDVINDNLNQVYLLPNSIGSNTSLTAGHNNDLYFLTDFQNLCRYDITNNSLEIITNLGAQTPGDIVFYKGNIIFKLSGSDLISAYNLSNATTHNIFCFPDSSFWNSYGIANHFNSCGDNIIILSRGSELFELNLENNTLTLLNIVHDTPIFGLATDTEYLASNCNTTLNENPCALSLEDYNFLNSGILFYPNPVGNYINIKNNIVYDTLSIIDINGRIINTYRKNQRKINVSELSNGVYFFKITNGEQSRIEKFVKN